MTRVRNFLFRLSAYRIAVVIGIVFTLFHARRLNSGNPEATPVIGRLEAIFHDLKFQERGPRETSGDVIVAAVDEKAIATIGRWPFGRDDVARLVDKLTALGARAIVFDIAYVDRAFEGEVGAERRSNARFRELSLTGEQATGALEALTRAQADGALPAELSTAIEVLDRYRALHDEHQKTLDANALRDGPDEALARSVHESGRVVLGSLLLDAREAEQLPSEELDAALELLSHLRIAPPVLSPELTGDAANDIYMDGARVPLPALLTLAAAKAPLDVLVRTSPDAPPSVLVGFFNTTADPDGVIRREPLVLRVNNDDDDDPILLPSLDLAGILGFYGSTTDSVRLWAAHDGASALESIAFLPGEVLEDEWATPKVSDFKTIPVDPQGRMLLNYYGPFKNFPAISLADVWTDNVSDTELQGKLVLVGVTATGTFDQRVTPFDAIVPGIATHAAALENILHGDWLRRPWWAAPFEIALLLALALGVGFLLTKVRVITGIPLLLLAMVGYHAFDSALFAAGFSVFSALPLIELLTVFVAQTLYRYSTEEREKAQIRRAFQFYLTKSVMDEMLQDPSKLKLGGDKRVLSVMFSDIRGFTTISENLSPEQLAKLINEYLTPMTNIVFTHGGTLDKFIGDALMAVWGAPVEQKDHALRCCKAAVEMIRELEKLQARWKDEGLDYPRIEIGIGINTGPMVVGNMGADQRFDYTVLGDNVNLAARLEGTNKDYGSHIIISEGTYVMVKDDVAVRQLGAVRVKGKNEPVRIYELLDDKPAQGELGEMCALFDVGIEHFREQRWNEAKACFNRVLERWPNDGPAQAYLGFCRDYEREDLGDDWDGVYTMTHK